MPGFSFYQLALFFIVYSFVGWCVEVIYYTVNTGKFVNRGFLNGPVCPIYGFGFVLVIVLLTPIKDNFLILFAGSCLVTTLIELMTGFALEKIFHEHWWDYSDEKFNFKGYICLKFTLAWGFACTFALLIVHAPIQGLLDRLPRSVGYIIIAICGAVYIADLTVTVMAICSITKELRLTKELSLEIRRLSDRIGEQISDTTSDILEKTEDSRAKLELRADAYKQKLDAAQERRRAEWQETKAEYERLKARYIQLFSKRAGLNKRRIEKAFPKLSLERRYGIKDLSDKIKAKMSEASEKWNDRLSK